MNNSLINCPIFGNNWHVFNYALVFVSHYITQKTLRRISHVTS